MMHRLIAVGVLPNQARNIRETRSDVGFRLEQCVQTADERRIAAHDLHEAGNILHDRPGILPGVRFGVIGPHNLLRVERPAPSAVGFSAAHESGGRVVDGAVIGGAFQKQRGVIGMA